MAGREIKPRKKKWVKPAALQYDADGRRKMMKRKFKKPTIRPGMQLGELYIMRRAPTPSGSSGGQRWLCECSCGNRITIPQWYLVRKEHPKRHCGCKARENINVATRERGIWYMMHRRCYNPTHVAYKHYGGANPPVTVCDRWNYMVTEREQAFANFLADMGKAPTRGHTLDRKDPYGIYEPSNCRWATAKEQMNNLKRHWLHPDKREKIESLQKIVDLGREVLDEQDIEEVRAANKRTTTTTGPRPRPQPGAATEDGDEDEADEADEADEDEDEEDEEDE